MIGTTASTLCALRRLTADWFKPSSLNRLQSRLDELSVEVVARMEAKEAGAISAVTWRFGIRYR